ncbi:phage tail protein [Actinomycetospora cinnamomea]|uniref:Phage tail-like protein n=1 Tax=Actinomycetospora cinnamomea TaxID=663609 RepID=A0A2U1F7N0_9PSEU|nr:phage tail protein [Actinomycetospora cinnamomea]PVZ08191.1 phage tail-like protein [Actinomycetospora cinnamomea]
MAQFSVNTSRLMPYPNFKFRVMWDDKYVAAVSKVSPLKRTTQVITHRDGGNHSGSVKGPGRTEYDAITLEQGVAHDMEFVRWANKVWDYSNAQADADKRIKEMSLKDYKKNIIIDVFNEAGQKAVSYLVYDCWVSEYQALSELDGSGNGVLIASIKIENHGWIRDPKTTEPTEAAFTDPA